MQEISCSVSYCYGEIYIYITYSPCLVKVDKLNKDKWTLKQLKIILLELTYDEELRKNVIAAVKKKFLGPILWFIIYR